ncbi:Spc7 kinetochore protein-domain-containing protein [Dichomitus squalens]|uniref:Spc7 kinetochore protein-domain-containing protein n=1 Tax=Dichomitus squalens TaxID=114155 RepID=A0A4Q9N7M0_9APHY|nr:Spc7 kinetochore protein-domain-containing protein [Dichomitus squalens]
MSKKNSPNRRRSIATLGHGHAKGTSHRRRAYSIAPGERISPAAKARRLLAPRKSILKASLNLPHARPSDAGESSTSVGADDTANITQTMDMTEVHGAGPRKSLARRVSFAAHTHVRLFHIQSPDVNSSSSPAAASPAEANAPAFITRAENDENAVPGRRRSSFRRRSSGAFSEFGERSMDMDLDDTAPLPQDFLPQRGQMVDGSAVEDDEFTEDDEDESDMEVTEAIALNIERKRSLSLGGNRVSLGGPSRRRSSIVTVTQHQSENQPPLPRPQHDPSETSTIQEEGESFVEEDVTASSAHTGSSYMSEGSSGEPMEFTIPVLQSMRQPKEPDPLWLQLRAMTHAGSEPYEPPPPESDDDALLIQPSPGGGDHGPSRYDESEAMDESVDVGGEQDMDLTSAMTRLQKARASLGIPPSPGGPAVVEEDSSFSEQEMRDDTFSTEDSFGDNSIDLDNRTMNLTQRLSLATTEESGLDETDIHDGVLKVPITPNSAPAQQISPPAASNAPAAAPKPAPEPFRSSVFSAPTPGGLSSSVFSAPPPSTAPKPPSSTPKPPDERARSPAKSPGPATVPKPFTFNLPRAGSPSKTPVPKPPSQLQALQPQPHRGSAAFAPPTVPKSPKRPASVLETPGSLQPPTNVGRLDPSRTAAFEAPAVAKSATQPVAGTNANRRASMSIRRPSGYFAQRKSLGAGVLPPNPNGSRASSPEKVSGGVGLAKPRASVGAQPSGAGLGFPLSRTRSDPGPSAGVGGQPENGSAMYPDLSELAQESQRQRQRAASPVPPSAPALNKGKEKESEEATRQAVAPPSPVRASPAPEPRSGSPGLPHRVASPILGSPANAHRAASPATASPAGPQGTASPTDAFVHMPRPAPVTHIGQPQRVVDVSMAMDIEPPTPGGTGVSQAWRESVPEEPQDEDGPSISIEQFFQMTGIRFMDELTMPRPRRSTVGPGQLRPRARQRPSGPDDLATSGAEEDPIPLAEFAIAMAVDMPRIDLYTAVARDLMAYIQECKKIYREAEEEALKDTPSLFREFAMVDESEQAMLIHQLKLIKANNIGTAKSQWYDWKLQWVEQLYESASQGFTNLEQDATYLAGVIKEAQDLLPELRQEYEEVTRLLEQEQADIDEIENSDQDYLNELKASIAEQSNEIEAFKADVSEAKAKLERLDEKLGEIESQKKEANTAINQARHIVHIQKESTSAEVFRLKAELEALEDLHLWHTTKLSPQLVEFVYASKYHVLVPCTKYTPICAQVQVQKTEQAKTKEKDSFPNFTELIVRTAHRLISESQEKLNLREVVERLSDFWSSCAQFRSQLTFLAIKYPLVVEGIFDDAGEEYLKATAAVMFPSAKGKAYISFLLDKDTYSRWPLSVRGLKSHVEVAYGAIQSDAILAAILNRLSQVSPADSHGCLLDACIEATEQYE